MPRNERKQTSKQEIKKARKKANKQERTQRKKIQDIRSNVAIPLEIDKGTVAGRPKAIGYYDLEQFGNTPAAPAAPPDPT